MKFKKMFAATVLCFLLIILPASFSFAAEKEPWAGVDVNVVEKYAKEYGRPARAPYINTDQGDLLLFVFTIAGAAGGFIVGYNWRRLFGAQK